MKTDKLFFLRVGGGGAEGAVGGHAAIGSALCNQWLSAEQPFNQFTAWIGEMSSSAAPQTQAARPRRPGGLLQN